jgi:hypothetical protein
MFSKNQAKILHLFFFLKWQPKHLKIIRAREESTNLILEALKKYSPHDPTL